MYLRWHPNPADIPERAEAFAARAGYYYENWDRIYGQWKEKVSERIELVRSLRFDPLPDREPDHTVFNDIGHSAGYRWERDFALMITTMYETYQWHFEMLNIGYAAYLTFFQFCQRVFPGISDQSVSRMVGGLHIELYRPDDELKRLAKSAEELGVGDTILAVDDVAVAFRQLAEIRGRSQMGPGLGRHQPTRGSRSTVTQDIRAAAIASAHGPTIPACRTRPCETTLSVCAQAK